MTTAKGRRVTCTDLQYDGIRGTRSGKSYLERACRYHVENGYSQWMKLWVLLLDIYWSSRHKERVQLRMKEQQ